MTNATIHGHRHARPRATEDADVHPAGDAAHAHSRDPASARAPAYSLIEASAGGRLLVVALVLAVLWTGVYWALH